MAIENIKQYNKHLYSGVILKEYGILFFVRSISGKVVWKFNISRWKMINRLLLFLPALVSYGLCAVSGGFYANVSEETMITPASAALAGSDLSMNNGVSVEGTPGNLPFDSLNRLSLSYAGYFQNTFTTSMLTWNYKPSKTIGVSLLTGYVYVPDIMDTRSSLVDESGELKELRFSVYSASKMFLRTGIGRRFDIRPDISVGAGAAVNAKRFRLPETGYGISMDAGVKAYFSKPRISAALQAENITSSYIYWNESFQERSFPHLRAGIGWEGAFPYLYGVLRLCYSSPDLLANEGIQSYTVKSTENDRPVEIPDSTNYEIYEKPSLLLTRGRFGAEYAVLRTVIFRIGFSDRKFKFGGGLRLWNERAGVDFAYIMHVLAGTYQLSVQYSW